MSSEPAHVGAVSTQPVEPAAFEAACREAMRLALGDVEAALRQSQRLLEEAGDCPQRRVPAAVARSHALAYAGELRAALEALESVRCLAALVSPRLRVLLDSASVQPLMRLGRVEEALAFAASAAAEALEAGEHLEAAKALVGKGAAERALGRLSDAIETLERAERLAGENRAVAAAAASNRAECMAAEDRLEEALECFMAAAEAFHSLGRHHAAAITRGNGADVLGRLGRLDEALAAFELARSSFESSGAALDAARLSCEEAEMLATAGALRAARDRYSAALPALRAAGAGEHLRRASVSLGLLLVEFGDVDGARPLLQLAIEDVNADAASRCMAIAGLASCSLAEGDVDRAAKEVALAVASGEGRPLLTARVHLVAARVAWAQGQAEAARSAIALADARLREVGLAQLRPLCGRAAAQIERDSGRTREAAALLTHASAEALGVLASTRSVAARAGLASLYAPLLADRSSILLDLCEASAADAVFAAADVASQPVASAAVVRAGPRAADGAVVSRLAGVQQAIARMALRAGAAPAPSQAGSLEDLLAQERVLSERLAGDAAGSTEGAVPMGITADEVRRSLGVGRSLLHLFDEAGAISGLHMGAGWHRFSRAFVHRARVMGQVRRLGFLAERFALAGPGGVDSADVGLWRGMLGSLHAELLGWVREAAGVERDGSPMLISAAPWLLGLPWAAIAAAGAEGVERANQFGLVSVVGSVRSIGVAVPRPAGAPASVCIAATDPSLPCAPEEAERCAAAWPGGRSLVGGSQAEVLEAVAGADVLHLATHGVFVPNRPAASRLLLGGGWMSVATLCRAIRPGACVVLSACHAGRSGGLAEDAAAIPALLLAAGAGQVVAAAWPLADRSAASVFGRFHELLAVDGRTGRAATALARATDEVVREGSAGPEAEGVTCWGAQ